MTTDILLIYLILAVFGLIIVLMALPTMLEKKKAAKKK